MPVTIASIQQNRLEFMTGFMSRRAISRETGVSLHRIRQLEHRGVSLGGTDIKALTNLSRRLAWSDLRNAGFSANQARRFRGHSIAGILEAKDRIQAIRDRLELGAFEAMKKNRIKNDITFNDRVLRQEASDAVFKGLQQSKKSIEDWENY